jgi:hypothetical protein
MSLDWVKVVLQGYRPQRVSGSEFLEALDLKPEDGYETGSADRPGKNAKVVLADVENAPGNSCNEQLQDRLRKAAEWLSARRERIENCRANGFTVRLLVNGWIDGDQMDLNFPPEFLLAGGQAGLEVYIVTND